ncbi:MAG: amino acid--[acyl-carrier-protein] ligase [Hyphomicrobiales bacterium]|nr:amino acid--[acyl-carrier-protein] ligase [Hyphomicrobiales bacterium]MDE2018663.1 amino acid--[acyl-carrier-protein] ligase [Hyphomicrobiales bacterium]
MNLAVDPRALARDAASAAAPDPLDWLAPVLFRTTGVPGVYLRTEVYEDTLERLAAWVTRLRPEGAETYRFPPVSSRKMVEKSGYLKSFPNLLGCVCGLHGGEAEIEGAVSRFEAGGDWTDATTPSDLVLSPAACYPVYPLAAARGPLPEGGAIFDVAADCFRAEPSSHLDRFQSFRMREFVCMGRPDDVAAFRDAWMDRAPEIADDLGLPFRLDVADDPFFGRVGRMKAVAQRQAALKFEMLVPLRGAGKATACMSFNGHRDHFGLTWDLRSADDAPAHTACVAFGMDRLTVALFAVHGADRAAWPARVRESLRL